MMKAIVNSESPDSDSSADVVVPISSFFTTSNVLEELNRQLSDLPICDGNGSITQDHKSFFELQKRLPDGSTIPATKAEIAAADFKTKLEQSAQFISQLESSEERQRWAERQRMTGNAFFQRREIREAMDVYLTCLVVKENTAEFLRYTFLPVLNNLAQCTLQLGMHNKTILFCEMALQEVSKAKGDFKNQNENKAEEILEPKIPWIRRDLQDAIASCKLFFKLAKALRLTGDYRKARKSLDSSLDCLSKKGKKKIYSSSIGTSGFNDFHSFLLPYKKAIKKEYRCLDAAEKEAKRNWSRQKLAMEAIMSSPPSISSAAHCNMSNRTQDKRLIQENRISSDYLHDNSFETRQFSKLRHRKYDTPPSPVRRSDETSAYEDKKPIEISYSQYYWSMVARVAKALLVLLGGNADIENTNSNSEASTTRRKRL